MQKWYRWLGVYALWRAALFAVSAFGSHLISYQATFGITTTRYAEDLPVWWAKFANFDGIVFLLISVSGYRAEQLPFFPLFPMSVRAMRLIMGVSPAMAAFTLNTLLFLAAFVVLTRLLALEKWNWKRQQWFFLTLILYPTAVFYTAAYNDSLFFFLACLTLLLGRQKRWWQACLVAAGAALTRLNGQALFAFLLTEYVFQNVPLKRSWNIFLWPKFVWQSLSSKKLLTSGIIAALCVPLAFLGYLTWIHLTFGDWHLFFEGVKVWHRNQLTFPLQTLWRYAKILILYPRITLVYWVAWGEGLATALNGLLLLRGWGRLRPSYWVFFAASIVIPMTTGTLQGMPRYGLHIFPMFLVLSDFVAQQKPVVRAIYFSVMAALLMAYTVLFTQGYFVA